MKTIKTIDFFEEVVKVLESAGFEYGEIFENLVPDCQANDSYFSYYVGENYRFFFEEEEESKYRVIERALNDYLLANGCKQNEEVLIWISW
jgi:hypothetical protein